MSKAVLISIKPEWCEKIVSGKKTVEVRKDMPTQVELPFKCYIYCSGGSTLYRSGHDGETRLYHKEAPGAFTHHTVLNGKVIGEFVCDWMAPLSMAASSEEALDPPIEIPGLGMTDLELWKYLGNGNEGQGWGISELKLYERPLELRELGVDKPPQSWRYVEEKGD